MVSRIPRAPSVVGLLLFASLAFAGGCSAADRADGSTTSDTLTTADTAIVDDIIAPADTSRPDSTASDVVTVEDTAVRDTSQTDVDQAALTALKDDPEWIVPGSVVARTAVAVAGTRVAWVEDPADSTPELVVWDTGDPDAAPAAYPVPNLTHPRELALGDSFLVYVDDRYGDADLFAVDLRSGAESALVTRVGAQEHPAVVGDTLVWADCRACVNGDAGTGREVYRRTFGGPEEQVTSDDEADDHPALGTLAGGDLAVAWVSGGTRLRVVGGVTDASRDTGRAVAGVALTEGVLAFRAPPLIINPDSMRPSDVRLWDIAADQVTDATFHAELAPGMDGAPRAADGVIAWLDGVAGAPEQARLSVVDAAGAQQLQASVDGAVTVAISGARVALLAPRADNDGLLDLWIRELP